MQSRLGCKVVSSLLHINFTSTNHCEAYLVATFGAGHVRAACDLLDPASALRTWFGDEHLELARLFLLRLARFYVAALFLPSTHQK